MSSLLDFFGSDPARILWRIVRGDSATIKVDFLENDEVTEFDTSGWEYASFAYDPKSDTEFELEVSVVGSSVTILATPDITVEWGNTYGATVAELLFDLQVTSGDEVWTPIVGTITVIGDVGGSL